MSSLLISSVGGSPEPLITGLRAFRPDRACFVASASSASQVEGILAAAPCPEHEILILEDEQDLASCVRILRGAVARRADWRAAAERGDLVVNFTGGTKVMAAAMVLAFSAIPAKFAYVGGARRAREGLGAVVDGFESILLQDNPLGLQDNPLGLQDNPLGM